MGGYENPRCSFRGAAYKFNGVIIIWKLTAFYVGNGGGFGPPRTDVAN